MRAARHSGDGIPQIVQGSAHVRAALRRVPISIPLGAREAEDPLEVFRLVADPGETFLVADSPSDVPPSHLAGVAVIGFANEPGKADAFARAGADAVTASLAEISAALRTPPPRIASP
jgi:phosphoglycolate phosphatase-like HAD superfamily hydrolase